MHVMISYAHKDEKLRAAFDDHLALLQSRKLLESWHDRKIRAGGDFSRDIDAQLGQADLILLLVSPAFFSSSYITGIELTRALDRQKAGEASVIPVILREGDYDGAPFSHLKELPVDGLAPGRSVTGRYWKNRDEALRNVTEGLRKEVEALKGRRLEQHAVRISLAKQQREPSSDDRAEIRSIGEAFGHVVAGRRVLWVDDHPENNALEVAALEALDVRVRQVTSTSDALEVLQDEGTDLVISDWHRGAPPRGGDGEGMRLLRQMRRIGSHTPFIVYCGWLGKGELASRRARVSELGGSGLTATPRELLRWTVGELVRSAAFDPDGAFVEVPLYGADAGASNTPRARRRQSATRM
jgi:CheY-like chemotaxis protein